MPTSNKLNAKKITMLEIMVEVSMDSMII